MSASYDKDWKLVTSNSKMQISCSQRIVGMLLCPKQLDLFIHVLIYCMLLLLKEKDIYFFNVKLS